ncbi:MAG TPA: efflux RND transporter periplasmic adaptor subunit [Planctomycetota bacterium]|jgi:multidrug efflux system membrane fusion protein
MSRCCSICHLPGKELRLFFECKRKFLLVALLLLAASAGCKKEAPATAGKDAGATRPPAAVTVVPAIARDAPIYLDEIARCASPEIVSIQPQVSGKVTEVCFEEGAELKKGDRLFAIDARPFQVQLDQAKAELDLNRASLQQSEASLAQYQAAKEQAQADLQQSKSRLELANMELARAKNLLETNAVSKQEFDSKKMAVEVGEAQIRSATAAINVVEAQMKQSVAAAAMAKARVQTSLASIEGAEINLSYATITSPLDGKTGQRLVHAGNVVTANAGALVVIQRMDPLYVDFSLPERELARVRGAMNDGALQVECRVPGLQPAVRTGQVSFLDNAVQEATGTVKLRARVANADRCFWPGQYVNARLLLGTKKNAVLIPGVATQVGQNGPFVYAVKNATAELRLVKLGQRQGDLVVVEEGVAAGESVVIAGQLMLFPGAQVTAQEGPAK